MNCVELFFAQEAERPNQLAIWLPNGKSATFSELREMGVRTQSLLNQHGIKPGDTVLVFDLLGPRLYGAIVGLLSLGVGVVLVEPWMPPAKINHAISFVKPKAFFSNRIGQWWGRRVKSIREIPHWIQTEAILKAPKNSFRIESMPGNAAGILTFTSGTTGMPKGMVRSQQYLVDQHRILSSVLHTDKYHGPDLCIFANFVLSNLAAGRTSLIVPPKWKASHLTKFGDLNGDLKPETLTCGPAFLMRLLETSVSSLKSIHVGGALTDCAIFEKGFERFPDAQWVHLYGSTEAEPVGLADAREAVSQSRKRGYFQSLYLGKPISDIQFELEKDTVWITGPHVCPAYLANEEENRKYKRKDSSGRVWHRMGDRIREDGGWWYQGRENQLESDFQLEQKIYSLIQSSAAFVDKDEAGNRVVYCQKAKERGDKIRAAFPEIKAVIDTTIRRDRRHRARIDRVASKRRSLWARLVG